MRAHNLWPMLALLLLTACGGEDGAPTPKHRGVYHWKTTYNPTEWEKQWMREHEVDRLYVKLFDVDAGVKAGEGDWQMVPVATTRFEQPLPSEVDVVPVVYITVDAIRAMNDHELYAKLIVKRIDDMMAEHCKRRIREVQLDCDWTRLTEHAYFDLARRIKALLHERGIMLSGTLRLHQLRGAVQLTPNDSTGSHDAVPFDRVLLMCYNTGKLQSYSTPNSILDFDDVEPYLRQYQYSTLPKADVTYPVYGWGVVFDREKHFVRLVNSHHLQEALRLQAEQQVHIREEWGEPREINLTQRALPTLDSLHTTILFHLDSLNLSQYSHDDIEAFYSR